MRYFINIFILASFLIAPMTVVAQGNGEDPKVVREVDYAKYVGQWNEIAHAPNFYQSTCLYSTAQYVLVAPNEFRFLNTCYEANGKRENQGSAIALDPAEPAKLELDLKTPSRLKYWIVRLDPDYQWAVVSGPGKKSLFILARSPEMEAELLKNLLKDLQEDGFDISSLIFAKRS